MGVRLESTSQQSFGFNCLELLGALLSVLLIWLISGIQIYEVIDRLLHINDEVNGKLMIAVPARGFPVNCLMIFWLGHDHSHHCHSHDSHDHAHKSEHRYHQLEECCVVTEDDSAYLVETSQEKVKISNINKQGAYLYIMTDMIQFVGVMIAGSIIWLRPEWLMVDLFSTLVFSAFDLSTTPCSKIFSVY